MKQHRSIDEPFEISADAEDLEKKRLREKQYYKDEYYAGQALAIYGPSEELNARIDTLLKEESHVVAKIHELFRASQRYSIVYVSRRYLAMARPFGNENRR